MCLVMRWASMLSTALAVAMCALVVRVDTTSLPDAQYVGSSSTGTSLVPIPHAVGNANVSAAARSTVELVVYRRNQCGNTVIGSAWSIGGDRVMTAAHVVAGGFSLEAVTADGRMLPATAVYFDAKTDIAILSVPGSHLPALNEAAGEPTGGTPVAIIGYPIVNQYQVVVPEQVAPGAVQQPGKQGVWFRGDHRHGYSGGPLVDLQGKVVGMAETGYFNADGTPSPKGGTAIGINSVNQAIAAATGSTAGATTNLNCG